MNKIFYLIIFSLTIISCNSPVVIDKNGNTSINATDLKKQKEDSISKHKQDSINKIINTLYKVQGKVMHRIMWCGGVQISPSDNSYKSKPFNNKKIFVIEGTVNSDTCKRVKELTTNAKGEFEFEIKSGQYGIIIEDWKQKKLIKPVGDDEEFKICMRKKYKEPDIKINVKNEPLSNLSYTVIGYCSGGNPCNPNGGTGRP